jgi:DNA (cytosine-5)-methyltransferase 1
MTRPLTVGSLCTGYGGLEMALNLLFGPELIDVKWHAESDPDASAVLKRWFDVPNLGDLTSAGFWDTAEVTDVQVGGIPCQPFSQAGRKHGTADHRYLWPYWRDGIEQHRPGAVILENVAALTRGKMRPIFDGIIEYLTGAGYDVRWCMFGACAIGAAHHRHRVFLLAAEATDATGSARQVPVTTCGQRGAVYLPTARSRDWKQGAAYDDTLPVTVIDLLPSPRGRDGSSGPGHGKDMQGAVALPTVASRELAGRWGKYADAVALHTHTLGRPAPEPTEVGPRGGYRLTAAFSEWLMMLPEGHLTSVLGRNAALTRAGNGVVPRQAATALALLLTDLTGEGPPWSG